MAAVETLSEDDIAHRHIIRGDFDARMALSARFRSWRAIVKC